MNSLLPLAPHGPLVSPLILGTWRWLKASPSIQDLNRFIHEAVELGITTIDTAEIYGSYEMEEALGKALQLSPGLRQKVQLITKAGIYVPNKYHPEREVAFYNASRDRLIKSMEKSLRYLRTDHVDLFLVHRPDPLTSAADTAQGLHDITRKGFSLHVGVSNYSTSQFETLQHFLEGDLVTNQVEYHPLNMAPAEDGVFDQCQRYKIKPLVWSPLAGGRLMTGECAASKRFLERCEAWKDRWNGAEPDQVAFAWIRQHPSSPLPILGTSKTERLKSAENSLHLTLTREEWFQIWTDVKGHSVP